MLVGVDDRHMRAVLAYCRELCGPAEAEDAADEVASELRSAADDGDQEVLETTQRIAAGHADLGRLEGDWRRMLETVRKERATRAFSAMLGGFELPPPPEELPPPPEELPPPPEELPPPSEELPPPTEAATAEPEDLDAEPLALPDHEPPALADAEPVPAPEQAVPVPEEPLAQFEEPVTQQYEAVVPPPAQEEDPETGHRPRRGLVVFPAGGAEAAAEAEASPEPVPVRPPPPGGARIPPSLPTLPPVAARAGGWLREYRVFWVTLLVGAVVVAVVGVLVGGSSGSEAISLPPPSGAVGRAAQTVPTAPAVPKRHVHRHRTVRAHIATSTTTAAIATSTTTAAVATLTTTQAVITSATSSSGP